MVDDDPIVRAMSARALERRLGVEVTESPGAMHALSLLRRSKFDLLIVDLNMPEMSGRELIDRARALFPDLSVGVWSGEIDGGLDGVPLRFAVRKAQRLDALLDAVSGALDVERTPSGFHGKGQPSPE